MRTTWRRGIWCWGPSPAPLRRRCSLSLIQLLISVAALLGPGQQRPLHCCCVKVLGCSQTAGPVRLYCVSLALQAVLVSAGFDAAEGDPLGGCRLTPHGYGRMTVRGDPPLRQQRRCAL